MRAQEKRPNVRLGDLLVEADLISREQLKEALEIQSSHRGRRVGEILIEMGAVSLRVPREAFVEVAQPIPLFDKRKAA